MPWDNEIDETAPQDTEFVSEGAMRFRELKRALIERLETAFKGFPGENPDRPGETLLFPIASVRVGVEADRPATPEREGAGWFSTDTGNLWIGGKDFVWRLASGGGGAIGGSGATRGFKYSPDEGSAAARTGSARNAGITLCLIVSGTTSAIGTIGVRLTDFNPDYDTTKVLSAVAVTGTPGAGGRIITHDTSQGDSPEDTWWFRVTDSSGNELTATALTFHAIFVMEPVSTESVD